jgi:hypothetical protein
MNTKVEIEALIANPLTSGAQREVLKKELSKLTAPPSPAKGEVVDMMPLLRAWYERERRFEAGEMSAEEINALPERDLLELQLRKELRHAEGLFRRGVTAENFTDHYAYLNALRNLDAYPELKKLDAAREEVKAKLRAAGFSDSL